MMLVNISLPQHSITRLSNLDGAYDSAYLAEYIDKRVMYSLWEKANENASFHSLRYKTAQVCPF